MQFDWNRLEAAVTKAVADGKIGSPRALRLTVHLVSNPEHRFDAETVMSSASNWFGGEPESEWTSASGNEVNVTLAKWPGGESALVSVSHGFSGSGGGDFTLLGSGGAMYHRMGGAGV